MTTDRWLQSATIVLTLLLVIGVVCQIQQDQTPPVQVVVTPTPGPVFTVQPTTPTAILVPTMSPPQKGR